MKLSAFFHFTLFSCVFCTLYSFNVSSEVCPDLVILDVFHANLLWSINLKIVPVLSLLTLQYVPSILGYCISSLNWLQDCLKPESVCACANIQNYLVLLWYPAKTCYLKWSLCIEYNSASLTEYSFHFQNHFNGHQFEYFVSAVCALNFEAYYDGCTYLHC